MPYYLGIDGGGTKTTCVVGDESQVLATATAGPSNVVRVGEERARASLQQSVRQACAAAGIAPAEVVRTCVGGSGAARIDVAEIMRRSLADMLTTPIDVVGDIQISLEAAFDTGPGVIVIGGTGSIAYGRNRSGKTLRAGGWGFAVGDEGSAHWIGRMAINSVLRAADPRDGSEPPPVPDFSLAAALMKAWNVASLVDVARIGNSNPPPDFAALFPSIAASADQLASEVLAKAGTELARVAGIVVRQLFAEEDAHIPVAMIGGVFRHAALVRQVFCSDLRECDARIEVNPQVVDPVEGALRMARRSARQSH